MNMLLTNTSIIREAINKLPNISDASVGIASSLIDRSIKGELTMENVTLVRPYAFANCTSLTSVVLPAAEAIGKFAFLFCDNLTLVDLPAVKTIGESAFNYCNDLISVNLSAAKTIGNNAFANCTSLTSVVLPAVKTIGNYAFSNCTGLTLVDLPAVQTLGLWVFNGCEGKLTTLILRHDALVTISDELSASIDMPNLNIYVPSVLIEDYKVATNWSTYVNQFRALEDYTVDGTITGELDKSKI